MSVEHLLRRQVEQLHLDWVTAGQAPCLGPEGSAALQPPLQRITAHVQRWRCESPAGAGRRAGPHRAPR